MADWGLQAVIRAQEYDNDRRDDGYCFGSIDIKKEYDQALLFSYPHLRRHHHASATAIGDELDQLYKPFYPIFDEIEFPPPPPPPAAAASDLNHLHRDSEQVKQDQEQQICGSASNTSQPASKLKKRKNQQKRVVVQVTADGLSSDPWAWRKYGQKPIKGSIYPRSYYRCSSSKGCLARRQVEQSCTDPSIYLLTYTNDHNHPQPTRRNSLAGINRNRFKTTPKSPTVSDGSKTVAISKDSPFHSPTTPSNSSNDDEVLQLSNSIKRETIYSEFDNQGHHMMVGVDDDEFMIFSDDFFEGLEDLGGYQVESSSSSAYNCTKQKFPDVLC